jgi:1-acyl-sn-glycerol-3-phosphate acyltransferase
LRWLLGRFFRFELTGLEHLPKGRYIVAANHPGWLEAVALTAFLPAERGLRAVAKREVTTAIPWRRWLIEQADTVLAIDPKQGDVDEAIRLAVRQLRGGAAVCIFPEPTHGPADSYEHLLPLRRGVAFLARVGESPVVPVGVADTRELWLGSRIRVNVGAPLPPPGSRAEEGPFLRELARRIERLRPPDEPPPDRARWRWLSRLF